MEAKLNAVEYLTCIGGDFVSSHAAAIAAHNYPNLWFAAGVHPHSAEKDDASLEAFETLAKDPKCVAIGEIGLDYYYEFSKKTTQKLTLEKFCSLGNKLNKPLVLHCRDKENSTEAYDDLYDIIKTSNIKKFVLHDDI